MGKSTTQKTEQENKPPAWAEPLLKLGASEAMNLYNSKTGYTPYSGPTQAGFSAPTLGGMNAVMAATGGTPNLSNATWQNNPAIAQARQLLTQQAAAKAKAAATPAAAPAQSQPLWYRNSDGYYVQAKPMSAEDVQKANKRTSMNSVRQQQMFRGGR